LWLWSKKYFAVAQANLSEQWLMILLTDEVGNLEMPI